MTTDGRRDSLRRYSEGFTHPITQRITLWNPRIPEHTGIFEVAEICGAVLWKGRGTRKKGLSLRGSVFDPQKGEECHRYDYP